MSLALACLSLSAYFAHHALHGRHGLEARTAAHERGEILQIELTSLDAVRTRLQRDVGLLSAVPPNPDIVDEIAREVLGYVHPRDRVHLLVAE